MSISTVVEWLNENEQRAYPLTLDSTNTLKLSGGHTFNTHALVLDANIVFIDRRLPAKVEILSIFCDSGTFSVGITGDQTFEGAISAYPIYVRNASGSLLVIGKELEKLKAVGPISLSFIENCAQFEPSVCIEIFEKLKGVNSVAFNSSFTLQGAVTFKDGYQASVRIKPGSQTVEVSVGPSEGLPLPCQDFFSVEDDCDKVVSWIGGATPKENGGGINLVGGPHVKIFNDPEFNQIFIGLDFKETDLCPVHQIPPKGLTKPLPEPA